MFDEHKLINQLYDRDDRLHVRRFSPDTDPDMLHRMHVGLAKRAIQDGKHVVSVMPHSESLGKLWQNIALVWPNDRKAGAHVEHNTGHVQLYSRDSNQMFDGYLPRALGEARGMPFDLMIVGDAHLVSADSWRESWGPAALTDTGARCIVYGRAPGEQDTLSSAVQCNHNGS